MRNSIVGYGELLLRLSPSEHGQLVEQSHSLDMSFAGAEANILADLSKLGHRTEFLSAFPENPIGRKAEQFLNQYRVNTDKIFWDNKRMGTYFIEHGSSIRGTRVTYDRKESSVCHYIINENIWNDIFKDASYFILTGVTSALSRICHQNIMTALKCAKDQDVKIVFDLNYRRSLWSGEEARKAFSEILPFVNILIGNIGSAFDVFDIPINNWEDYDQLCKSTLSTAQSLQERGDFDCIAMTMRIQNSASQNTLGGLIMVGDKIEFSHQIDVDIVDRVGGGDAFSAGILHGIIREWEPLKIAQFANACYAATHTFKGDINLLSEKDLANLAEGHLKGFTKR